MIVVLALVVALVNIRQPYPDIAPLQHIPTLAFIVAAPPLLVRLPLSNRSVAALLAFGAAIATTRAWRRLPDRS